MSAQHLEVFPPFGLLSLSKVRLAASGEPGRDAFALRSECVCTMLNADRPRRFIAELMNLISLPGRMPSDSMHPSE